MLVSFRSCGPKDHKSLLKLVIAYNKFERIPVHRNRLSQGLDVLLRNPSGENVAHGESRKAGGVRAADL